jgi:hypothetical protein
MNTNSKMPEKMPIFICEKCDFKCSRESNFKMHVKTNKHNLLMSTNKKMPKNAEIIKPLFICICGNAYKFASSLCYHKKKCVTHNTKPPVDNNISSCQEVSTGLSGENLKITTDVFMKLVNDNQEMIKIIKEQQQQINQIIPKLGNITNNTNNTTNNHFNLNVFLNEKCKDALDISEFIDSLKITLADLVYSKNNGLVRGITDVMIKGLKDLEIHKRPIHCTDAKRDTMYIKDNARWEKDENHTKMKETIEKIADKERNALQKWADDNPDWYDTEAKQIEYLTMMRSICEPIENDEKNEKKIIRSLGKEIFLDKNELLAK